MSNDNLRYMSFEYEDYLRNNRIKLSALDRATMAYNASYSNPLDKIKALHDIYVSIDSSDKYGRALREDINKVIIYLNKIIADFKADDNSIYVVNEIDINTRNMISSYGIYKSYKSAYSMIKDFYKAFEILKYKYSEDTGKFVHISTMLFNTPVQNNFQIYQQDSSLLDLEDSVDFCHRYITNYIVPDNMTAGAFARDMYSDELYIIASDYKRLDPNKYHKLDYSDNTIMVLAFDQDKKLYHKHVYPHALYTMSNVDSYPIYSVISKYVRNMMSLEELLSKYRMFLLNL